MAVIAQEEEDLVLFEHTCAHTLGSEKNFRDRSAFHRKTASIILFASMKFLSLDGNKSSFYNERK